MPARFYRFSLGSLIHLVACKEGKEKEENAVVYALRQVAREARRIEVYPVTKKDFFSYKQRAT